MFAPVVTKNLSAVRTEVQAAYLAMFPSGDYDFVGRVFSWVEGCFAGRYGDYQAIDARYHDLEHTLQGTLCLARLLRCRHEAGVPPKLSSRCVELGLIGILLHDTGYLKHRNDTTGTGAKYTATHVLRSLEFTHQLLTAKGFPAVDIRAVQNMIRCTGLDAFLESIGFESEEERLVGHALATADLLGQMAAEDYVEKILRRHLPQQIRRGQSMSDEALLLALKPDAFEEGIQPRAADHVLHGSDVHGWKTFGGEKLMSEFQAAQDVCGSVFCARAGGVVAMLQIPRVMQ